MDHDFQLKQLNLNIEKIEKIVDDLMDDLESKRKKIDYLKEQIELNTKKIDKIIDEYNADSKN